MAAPVGLGLCVNLSRVCIGEPVHEGAEITVCFGIEKQMPVIRHEDICQNAHIDKIFCLTEQFLEELVVFLVVENLHATVGTVDDMINLSADIDTGIAWHESIL